MIDLHIGELPVDLCTSVSVLKVYILEYYQWVEPHQWCNG